MKSILYVGALLMAGAGIYGFADYKKTSHTKEFQLLYHGKEKSGVAAPASQAIKEKNVQAEGDLPVPAPEITAAELSKMAANKKKSANKKPSRKLNYKQFSRAELRTEVVPEEGKK